MHQSFWFSTLSLISWAALPLISAALTFMLRMDNMFSACCMNWPTAINSNQEQGTTGLEKVLRGCLKSPEFGKGLMGRPQQISGVSSMADQFEHATPSLLLKSPAFSAKLQPDACAHYFAHFF